MGREKMIVSEIPFFPCLIYFTVMYYLLSNPTPPKCAWCWAQIDSLLTTAVFIHL